VSTVTIDLSGPLFDGRALAAVDDFLDEAKTEIAQQALAEVHDILDRSIRHPTPYYETQVRMHPVGSDRVVDDRGVVYGPWLEGVGTRNLTTRFKGYHAFRIAHQVVEQRADDIAERVLHRYLPRMGG
jgi:hypothetical protein